MNSLQSLKVSLDTELTGFDGQHDLGAGAWIAFDYVPSDVSVQVAFSNNSQSRINVKQGMKIKIEHSSVFLWSTGTSDEEMIINHWAGDDMEIIYPPSSDFDNLQNLGAGAIASLEKIFNPIFLSDVKSGSYAISTSSTVISYIANCDEIKVDLTACSVNTIARNLTLTIDGIPTRSVACYWGGVYGGQSLAPAGDGIFKNVRGKVIEITISHSHTGYKSGYRIEEYTLKT